MTYCLLCPTETEDRLQGTASIVHDGCDIAGPYDIPMCPPCLVALAADGTGGRLVSLEITRQLIEGAIHAANRRQIDALEGQQ